MLKLTRVVVILLLVNLVKADSGMSVDDIMQALEPICENCDPPATKEQLKELVLSKKDASKETKCIRWCLMQQFDMAKEGSNQMNEEKAVQMMGMVIDGKDAECMEIVKKCNAKNAAITDNCEAAHEHTMCVMQEFKTRGWDIPTPTEK